MSRLLLDEHLSPKIAAAVRRLVASAEVFAISEWQGGALLGHGDEEILAEADRQSLTLVTCDLRTIPVLLKNWAAQGRTHGGVILVSRRTFAPGDIGAVAKALASLLRDRGTLDWKDKVVFLRYR
jgi:hypothetical protein